MIRRRTTHDEDLANEVRFCRICEAAVTESQIDWDYYDYCSDLGETVICLKCGGKERTHDRP